MHEDNEDTVIIVFLVCIGTHYTEKETRLGKNLFFFLNEPNRISLSLVFLRHVILIAGVWIQKVHRRY